jgi:hypothetical protein
MNFGWTSRKRGKGIGEGGCAIGLVFQNRCNNRLGFAIWQLACFLVWIWTPLAARGWDAFWLLRMAPLEFKNSTPDPSVHYCLRVLHWGSNRVQLHQLGPDWTNSTHQCTPCRMDGWCWTGNTFSLYYLCPIGNQPQWSAIC